MADQLQGIVCPLYCTTRSTEA